LTGHLDLAERLVECMYEVTDKLTYFLCNQKPDHKCGEHLIIPEWAATLERSELAFEARNKLQMVIVRFARTMNNVIMILLNVFALF
jgi:G protein-coupled receptor kinase interacting protein 2